MQSWNLDQISGVDNATSRQSIHMDARIIDCVPFTSVVILLSRGFEHDSIKIAWSISAEKMVIRGSMLLLLVLNDCASA
jgi:hypothetical protein